MKKRSKSLADSSLTRDESNQNLFHYQKIDRSDPDNPRIISFGLISTKYIKILVMYYKFFVCKHLIKLVDIFGFSIKGYKKVEEFATNAKRGPKKGSLKTKDPLAED